jgi:predicted MFS family arabinose efflux permease
MTGASNSAAPRAPLNFLGLACAIGVSTIYFNQPLLVDMGRTYGAPAGKVMFVSGATQVGYALGLLLFVPLGDVLERRALMLRMYAAVAVALLLVSLAPTLAWLIVGSIALGLVASVTHIVLPIAPDMVKAKERGRAIGTVMMGLLLGILLARSFAGWVSHIPSLFVHAPRLFPAGAFWVTDGWRYVFVIAALVNIAFLLVLARVMPKSSQVGGLVFASFSCFWTTLAFLLSSHYGLGAGTAGAFGLVGAAGALIAPIGGRMADRRGTRWVLTVGITLLGSSYLLLWAGEQARLSFALHIAVLVVGVVVLDMGAQLTQVGNQTRIFGLVPSARSRLNTVYMTIYFAGAAAGSALSTVVWGRWRWDGVCGLALGLIALAGLRHALGTKTREPFHPDSRSDHAPIETLMEI